MRAVYASVADEQGLDPESYIQALLQAYGARSRPPVSEQERRKANARLRRHIFSQGHPKGT